MSELHFDRSLDGHYFQAPNHAFRGRVINIKYAGLYGYLLSHREGWELTIDRIVNDLGASRRFVRDALDEFERAGCLRRGQARADDTSTDRTVFGSARWWVTDLPFVLMAAGITDPDEIKRRVDERHAQWVEKNGLKLYKRPNGIGEKNPRSRLMSQDETSHDVTAQDEPSQTLSDGKRDDIRRPSLQNTNETEDQSSVGASDNEPGLFDSLTQASSDAEASKPTKPNTSSTSKQSKRGTRLPDDFTVTVDMVAWARKNTPLVDEKFETDQFIDYWASKPGRAGVKLDWRRTWQTWMRNAQKRAEERNRPNLRVVGGYQPYRNPNPSAYHGDF